MGKPLSEETKAKIRAKALGRKHSEESKAKMSKSHKGNHANLGKHWSQETREKMRIAHLGNRNPMFGKHLSEETKQKLRENRMGDKSPNWKGDKATPIAGQHQSSKNLHMPKRIRTASY